MCLYSQRRTRGLQSRSLGYVLAVAARRGASQSLVACLAGIALVGCGSNGSTTTSSVTTTAAGARAAWAASTQALCRQKRAAIAALGGVHITYAGIARVGLPAVKRSLERYLTRLLAVLRGFSTRQRQLPTPSSVVPELNLARSIDAQSQAATRQLRQRMAAVASPGALATAFGEWLAATRQLAQRGDAVAQRLNLAVCRSGA